ncbi:unnamed protein product, partial [Didymodactylos carnosus]
IEMKTKPITRDARYKNKIRVKRILSKTFDRDFKRKKALQQRKWRSTRQQKQAASSSSLPDLPTTEAKSVLRKKEGKKRRRAKARKVKQELQALRDTVQRLAKENKNLRAGRCETPPPQLPTALFLDNVSPSAKRRATNRLRDTKDDLARGSQSALRAFYFEQHVALHTGYV